MRREFADELYKAMQENDRIYLFVGDLGYKVFDQHFKDFPARCINCGAAEQAMMGIAVGLAQEGKIPFVYTITPFLIYRPFETIKLYLDHELANVKLVGSGRDKDYAHDGVSHDATDIPKVLDTLPNIVQLYPESASEIPQTLFLAVNNNKPTFISLKR